jgi:ribonucleoside-diphosphate reductase alpha chain
LEQHAVETEQVRPKKVRLIVDHSAAKRTACRAILQDFKFLPGGRIQAGAGTARHVTLFNCFVMGIVEDSILGIFRALQEGALTMQQGGGIGVDFSTLRPRGTPAKGAGSIASGAVSFMHLARRRPSA